MSTFRQVNQKIETAVVNSYKKVEDGVVSGYKKVEDKFVETFLAEDGETVAEAKDRIRTKQKQTEKSRAAHDRRINK